MGKSPGSEAGAPAAVTGLYPGFVAATNSSDGDRQAREDFFVVRRAVEESSNLSMI
jgi:hypothetical protein